MGIIGDAFRRNAARSTAKTIFRAYERLKTRMPQAPERDALRTMLNIRRPFWSRASEYGYAFKGVPAIEIFEGMSLFELIMFVNIWEQIIIKPADVRVQSISHAGLWQLVALLFDGYLLALGLPQPPNRNKIIDDFVSYVEKIVGDLGGKIL